MTAALRLQPSLRPDTLALVEELVADAPALDRRCASRADAAVLLPRLLGLSLASLAAFAAAQTALDRAAATPLHDRALVEFALLFASYAGGLLGALGSSMPAFFVGAVLAGIEEPPWRLAAAYVRALASSALWLLGVLPLYVGAAVATHQLLGDAAVAQGDLPLASAVVYAGFGLPFAAGIVGRRSLLRSIEQLGGEEARGARTLVAATTALMAAMAAGGASRIVWELGALL